MIWHDQDRSEAGADGVRATDLKICDLCGALNLADNAECFICRWRGHFERRPEIVQLAIEILERRHGRLDEAALADFNVCAPPRELSDMGFSGRLAGVFHRICHWFSAE